MKYWLIKSEPKVYSIDDLKRDKHTLWDGIRNYQARNFLRQMKVGDLTFFYHSNANPPGIVGLSRVIQKAIADPTQFDASSPYYDAKSTLANPRWSAIEIEFVNLFFEIISLDTLKAKFKDTPLLVIKPGNRLSVMPVDVDIAEQILQIHK